LHLNLTKLDLFRLEIQIINQFLHFLGIFLLKTHQYIKKHVIPFALLTLNEALAVSTLLGRTEAWSS
jgi:hypothetical protein